MNSHCLVLSTLLSALFPEISAAYVCLPTAVGPLNECALRNIIDGHLSKFGFDGWAKPDGRELKGSTAYFDATADAKPLVTIVVYFVEPRSDAEVGQLVARRVEFADAVENLLLDIARLECLPYNFRNFINSGTVLDIQLVAEPEYWNSETHENAMSNLAYELMKPFRQHSVTLSSCEAF